MAYFFTRRYISKSNVRPDFVRLATFFAGGLGLAVSGGMIHETTLGRAVIGHAIEVHRTLGPGLLESIYRECLALEFVGSGLVFEQERPIHLDYKHTRIRNRLRLDFVVDEQLISEVKSVDQLMPIHKAQAFTCLRLTGLPQALLMNFNVTRMVDGIRSFIQPGPSVANISPPATDPNDDQERP